MAVRKKSLSTLKMWQPLSTTVQVLFTFVFSLWSLPCTMDKLDPAIIGAHLSFSSKHMDLIQAGLVAEVAYRSAGIA